MTIADLPGAAGGAALARCVACGPGVFAERHWGKAPLLTRAAELPRSFSDLLGAAAVDELVSRRGLRTPFLRMAKEGTVLPPARYARGGGAGATIADQAADDRVLAQLDDGATLVLQALHRTWPPLVEFASTLSAELGHPVHVNAYITPPQNRGFAPHYDVHDVFVLQVAGRKHWTTHEPVLTDPTSDQPWESVRELVHARARDDAPLIDTVLEPGDALYLPRGTIHSATALGDTSIHLTVGIHPVTRLHLVRELLAAMQDEPLLRTSLPMGADLADPDVLAPHLAATLDALHRRLDAVPPTVVADALADLLRAQTRPEPIAPLAQLAAAERLDARTPLRLRANLHASASRDGEAIVVDLLGRRITVPGAAEAALKTVLSGVVFTPAELIGLDADEQVTVSRRLLREGVVVPAT